jgi:hypothetical protein
MSAGGIPATERAESARVLGSVGERFVLLLLVLPPMFLVIRYRQRNASPFADEGLRGGLGNIGVML